MLEETLQGPILLEWGLFQGNVGMVGGAAEGFGEARLVWAKSASWTKWQ